MFKMFNNNPSYRDKALQKVVSIWIDRLKKDQRLQINIRNEINGISPADIENALDKEGWKRYKIDNNGWQNDCWLYYDNEEFEFDVIVYYCGFYGDLEIHRTDIDD